MCYQKVNREIAIGFAPSPTLGLRGRQDGEKPYGKMV